MTSSLRTRECLYCGMLHKIPVSDIHDRDSECFCSKCDSPLLSQSDGSILTVDIAHSRETVPQALHKFERALERAWRGNTEQLRLIVGGGAIRDAVQAELYYKCRTGTVLAYTEEAGNRGALLAKIR